MLENFEIVSYSRHLHCKPCPLDDKIRYYDLTFLMNGKMEYTVNGVSYSLSDGDIILIPRGSTRVRVGSEETCKYFSINFIADIKRELPIYMKGFLASDVFAFWNLLYQITKSDSEHKEELIRDVLSALLLTIYEAHERRNENRHILKIKRYIAENFTKRISLKNIADCAYLNPSYCSYLVKKELGVSVFELINKERIAYAKSLILEGGRSLYEISAMVGFDNYGYFSRQFKEITGTSPSTYKHK